MACRCKKGTAPLGSSGSATTTTTTTALPQWYAPGTSSYSLKVNGTTQTFGSRLEYDAARRRLGL